MAKYEIEFSYEIEIKTRPLEVYCVADIESYMDIYGQDADGNRGVMFEAFECKKIKVYDSRNNDITTKLLDKYSDQLEILKVEAEYQSESKIA